MLIPEPKVRHVTWSRAPATQAEVKWPIHWIIQLRGERGLRGTIDRPHVVPRSQQKKAAWDEPLLSYAASRLVMSKHAISGGQRKRT
jgi:hypothetical protein